MTRPISSNLLFVFVVGVALSGFSARQSLAAGKECVTCTTNRICLEWSQQDPPQEGTDFGVDCTGIKELKGSGIFIGETKISDPFDFSISMQRATWSPPGGLRAESTGHHVRRLNSDL